uniref:SFRICE_000274 n=1 Tax=Spodoptera frugiperda TaxID=7108 RepID=A0A2H1W0R9_SPOFR
MNEDEENYESTWTYMLLCVEPTVYEGFRFVRDLLLANVALRLMIQMSMLSMTSAGFGLTNDCRSEVQVTKPFFIELPRSLVQVETDEN